MSSSDSLHTAQTARNVRLACPDRCRKNGWNWRAQPVRGTGEHDDERQLRFLSALARTRSVTKAARAAGMSRERAYRLRNRSGNALFAAPWDEVLSRSEGHEAEASRRRRTRRAFPVFRAKPAKVTKWTKCTTPEFDRHEKALRELSPCPSVGSAFD